MNRPDAETLLGGFATGTLTEAEKATLFSAALEDQELFDALMDEEALRELLADPEVRLRLLAVLSPAGEGKVNQLWRKPAFIGLAASLFALVTTSLLVYRSPQFRALPVPTREASAPPQIPAAVDQDKAEAVPPGSALPKPVGSLKAKKSVKQEPVVKADSRGVGVSPLAVEVDNHTLGKEEEKDSVAVAAAPRASKAAEFAYRAEPAGAPVAEAQLAKRAKGSIQAGAGLSAAASSPFQSTLEHLQGTQVRLRVTWAPRGHLYVLKRTSAGAAVLTPIATGSDEQGLRTALFELALGVKDVLDVFVLAAPVADPGTLPATGPVQGERRRVYPE